MSGNNGFPNTGKKAVHVKWAGKTIALGTFPATEADEKCARAKALTRAWRSTMRPKPSREWVMLELERLGVRVVSGRLGRKAGEDADEEKKNQAAMAHLAGGPGDRRGSMGWAQDGDLSALMQHNKRPSMGMMMGERRGSLGSLGQVVGLDGTDPTLRGTLGGDFNMDPARRNSSLGLGSSLPGGGLGGMGMSVNPNQHYEMLKLHHMNLLNEIQETTLMMNLYQQQQLQQQQQQLQQQANAEGMTNGGDNAMNSLMAQPNNSVDQMMNLSQQQRASLGLGSTQQVSIGGTGTPQQQGMMQMQNAQQQQQQQAATPQANSQPATPSSAPPSEQQQQQVKTEGTNENNKRPLDDNADAQEAKKSKTEEKPPVATDDSKPKDAVAAA